MVTMLGVKETQSSVKHCNCQQLPEVVVKLFPHLTKMKILLPKPDTPACLSKG